VLLGLGCFLATIVRRDNIIMAALYRLETLENI